MPNSTLSPPPPGGLYLRVCACRPGTGTNHQLQAARGYPLGPTLWPDWTPAAAAALKFGLWLGTAARTRKAPGKNTRAASAEEGAPKLETLATEGERKRASWV